MTDAHCHVSGGDPSVREFLIGRDFIGVHPWACQGQSMALECSRFLSDLRAALEADTRLGIGEIGLDRLKDRNISPQMRELFEAQLRLAFEFGRPVVLHGAKCWGQVVKTVSTFEHSNIPNIRTFPSILFHGFSRSDGLIPDIVALGGFISVGPAVLNDHAVNYRALVKKIPLDRLLLETDRTPENAAECPSIREVAVKVAELRGQTLSELESITDQNAERFSGIAILENRRGSPKNPGDSPQRIKE